MAGKTKKSTKKKKIPLPKAGVTQKTKLCAGKTVDHFFAKHRYAGVWLSGLLSVIGLVIVYAFMGIYPFGDKSVATVDMIQQYIPFYASLKNAVFGGHGLAYSQSLGMGGSYWGLIGYYLTSPFAALSLLVPNDLLLDYMALQELVKVGLAGCSFACFHSRKFHRNDLTVPLLSVCYAMSSFMLVHLCTIIWSDCLVLLPLIVCGLEELLRGKKPWLYILCLSLAGIFNYYMALMIGIYLVFYTAATLFIQKDTCNARDLMKKFAMFGACSLLSVGAAAGILLPSALLLRESGTAADEPAAGFWAMNPAKLVSQMLYHADSHSLNDASLPLIYCSVLMVLCLPLFFVCKEICVRIKIAFGGLAGFLMLSLTVNGLNFLWHGAHIPNRLPYRFAFLLVFTLLTMAGFVINSFDSFSAGTFNAVLCGVMVTAGIVYFAEGRSNHVMFIGTLVLAVGYTVIFFLHAEQKFPSSGALILALMLVLIELTSGGVMAWRTVAEQSPYEVRKEFLSHYRRLDDAVKGIAVSDSDVYRVGALTEGSLNNNTLVGQSGMSYFSSTNNGNLMRLLRQAGYNSDMRVSYYYKGFTPLMDSVMNVNYVIYNQDVGEPPYLQRFFETEGYYVYRNTLALPRAFAVADHLLQWNTEQDNPFDVQNDFMRCAVSDSDLTVYEPAVLSVDREHTFGAAYENGRVKIPQGGRLVLFGTSERRRHLYVYVNGGGASGVQLNVG